MPLIPADLEKNIKDYWLTVWEKKKNPDTGDEYISLKKTYKDLTEGLGDVIVNYIKDNADVTSPWAATYVPPSGGSVPDPLILITYTIALKNGYEKFKGGNKSVLWAENLNKLLRGAFELNLPALFSPAKHSFNPMGTVVVPPPTLDYDQNWKSFSVSVCTTFKQSYVNPTQYSGTHSVPGTPFSGATTGMTIV